MSIGTTPKTIGELKKRCKEIAGKSIADIAGEIKVTLPKNLAKHKGWLGDLLEIYLGATAGNKSMPDFTHLGIELKTLPVNEKNLPLESTYVCTAPFNNQEIAWESSRVKNKLNNVLWVPILANKYIPLENRTVGRPFFWSPTKNDENILKEDWEDLTAMLYMGKAEALSAKWGRYLQIRPKAANSRILVDYVNESGKLIKIVPKGFYLRANFTKKILNKAFYE